MGTSAQRRSTPSVSQTLWTILAATASVASAIKVATPVTQPVFELERLGRVGFAGDFSGVSLYEYTTQTQSSPFSNGSQSILTQLPNGLFISLGLADAAINAMCMYELQDGTQKGVVVGGSFTSLGGVKAKGIALYDADGDRVTAMGDFDGKVNALLCDKTTSRVYVGGSFSLNNSENAVAWNDGKWENLPFQGFTNPVTTIARSNNDTIIFGGNFDGLQKFTAPEVKDAQSLNLGSAIIETEQTADGSDPAAITCTNNNTSSQWLLKDGQKGAWTANFRFEIFPTKLRLVNANKDGRGTKTFRLTAYPLGGIMNLTYLDLVTNERKHCDASCPLARSDLTQDFQFVNPVGMWSFRLDIFDFYGAGGGLSSVQIFQDNISTYAIPDFNEAGCSASLDDSSSTVTGDWSQTVVNDQGDSDYLSADIDTTASTSQVVFEPHIEQSGRYQMLIFTPGCIQDSSCSTRGSVVITGAVKTGSEIPPETIFQTNDYDKFDAYNLPVVNAISSGFRPRITIAPVAGQGTVRIVAQKIQFKLIEKTTTTSNSSSSDPGSKLNGLFEYDLRSAATDLSTSAINAAGLDLDTNASVTAVVVKDDFTYVGGDFSEKDKFQNFFVIDKNSKALPDVAEGGLNAPVSVMLVAGDLIYVGGSFNKTKTGSTAAISHIAAYDTAKKSWVALGGGVDNSVSEIIPITLNLTSGPEDCFAISGNFTNVRPDNNDANKVAAAGFAVWVPSKSQWLEAMDGEEIELSGSLTAFAKSNDIPVYAGSMASNTLSSSGAIFLLPGDKTRLERSPLEFTTANNTLSKRDVSSQNITGVVAGAFYVVGGKNITVLGGRFDVEGKDGTVSNLAFIDGGNNEITGATDEFTSGSTIRALKFMDKLLFVGGTLEGPDNIGGLAIWNMDEMKLAVNQPQPLTTTNSTTNSTAIVRDISIRPDSKDIYVAGDFTNAGSLSCANICIYQNDLQQWVDATPETPGSINVMHWTDSNHLYVAGDMFFNNTKTYFAIFNAVTGMFGSLDADVSSIPGPVTGMAFDSNDNLSFFIAGSSATDGSPYLMKLQDKKFVALGQFFALSYSMPLVLTFFQKTNSALHPRFIAFRSCS